MEECKWERRARTEKDQWAQNQRREAEPGPDWTWGGVWAGEGTGPWKKEEGGFRQSCRMRSGRFTDAHWALRHADLRLRHE